MALVLLLTLILAAAQRDDDCRKDWAATWSFTPSRSIFTGNLTVTQAGCNVTERWWAADATI